MKRLIIGGGIVLLSAIALTVFARHHIWSHARLGEVCKEKTQAYFLAKGKAPMEWLERPPDMNYIGPVEPSIFNPEWLFETDWNFYGHWRVGQRQYDIKCVSGFSRSIDHVHYEIDASP